MYDEIYSLNFAYSFIISSIFLLVNVIFSFNVYLKFLNNQDTNFKKHYLIIIFFLIFCFYSIIFNLLILINFNALKYILIPIILFKLFFILKNNKILLEKFSLKFFAKTKIVFALFILFYLVAILPMSDADSIVISQNIPATIFFEGFNNFIIARDIEFTVFSNTETLLLISPILSSDNFGAQLNLISLFFLIYIYHRDNKNFLLIILSSPLIIYFISAQKLQLFFAVLYLLLFVLIHKNLIHKKFELFFVVLLLTFYSSGKVTYILFSIPLFIYLLKNNIKIYKTIIFYSLISTLIIYGPLFLIKEIYFNNIFAPFFDGILGANLKIYNALVHSYRSTEGWLTDPSNIYLYLRPFVSFELSTISSSLGIIFLFMVMDFKLQKDLKFIPLFLIILIFLTGQILPRYYFEAFLLLAFFYNYKIKFIKLIIYSQLFAVILLTSIFIYISYFELKVFQDKTRFQNKFSYSFFNMQQIKKKPLDGNVLDFSSYRDSIYFKENIYSTRYIDILHNFNNYKEKHIINFIKENSIKYLIVDNYNQIPKCVKTNKIDETIRKNSVRNFLIKTKTNNYKIFKIIENIC